MKLWINILLILKLLNIKINLVYLYSHLILICKLFILFLKKIKLVILYYLFEFLIIKEENYEHIIKT